ncbi:MAG: tyrosine/phenylalanine carboxypeptidase domain-containing protein, partial [Nitrospinota bacterium]
GPLGPLYEARRQELLSKTRLLAAVGTPAFTTYSQAVYGRPSPEGVRRAEQFLAEHPPHEWPPREMPASVLKERFAQALASRSLHDWRVMLRTEGVVGVSINHRQRAIEVHAERSFSEHEMARLIVHEIDTHILRRVRAEATGLRLFAIGTAGYLATEEGLAVYQEAAQGVLEVNRLRFYAGQLLAVNTALIGGFEAVFESLVARGFTDEEAFHITLRVKRGLGAIDEPGTFTKDHCYFTGMCAVEAFVEAGGRIEELFLLGKVGMEDLPLLRRVGLVEAMRMRATA